MSVKCGIVGLPNVGKSTLFNAVTQTQHAEAANYPFCTIEPNVGRIAVPDLRLKQLAKVAQSKKTIYNQLELVDIAGLVKGANKGAGRGNQFLNNIREVDAIIHVLRCFEDDAIEHVNSVVDPVYDAEIIELELILSDIQSVERRLKNVRKLDQETKTLLEQVLVILHDGKPAIAIDKVEDSKLLASLQLITSIPMLYVCNVDEAAAASGNVLSDKVKSKFGNDLIVISAQIEEEIANLTDDESERLDFLNDLGLSESGLSALVRAGYSLLDLITFFTIGPKEAHAWSVKRGSCAPQAAGVIHTDFEKGFIKADVISCIDYIECDGEVNCRDSGKVRSEGKDYIVQDGDAMHFKFN